MNDIVNINLWRGRSIAFKVDFSFLNELLNQELNIVAGNHISMMPQLCFMIHQSKRKAYKTERFNTFQTSPFCAKLCPCRHYTAKPGIGVKPLFNLCVMKREVKSNILQKPPITQKHGMGLKLLYHLCIMILKSKRKEKSNVHQCASMCAKPSMHLKPTFHLCVTIT